MQDEKMTHAQELNEVLAKQQVVSSLSNMIVVLCIVFIIYAASRNSGYNCTEVFSPLGLGNQDLVSTQK